MVDFVESLVTCKGNLS